MPLNYTILSSEIVQYGCPHCGYRSGFTPIQWGNLAIWRCAECEKTTYVIHCPNETLPNLQPVPPPLTKHPRFGIPSHGRPDKRPKFGGDFFRSRGIGTDSSPGCFACEISEKQLYSNIAAHVQCKAAGERIVAMFNKNGVRLDYREYEPDYVQVKIGACKAHLNNLKFLDQITSKTNIITDEIITAAINLQCKNFENLQQMLWLKNLKYWLHNKRRQKKLFKHIDKYVRQPKNLIYTIGYTKSYETCFEEQESPEKLGRTKNYQGEYYSGGCVWKTYREALQNCPEGYSVYGVKASWKYYTEPSKNGNHHDLLRTSKLVKLK